MSCLLHLYSGFSIIRTPLFLKLGKSVQISEFVRIVKSIDLYRGLCSNTLIDQSFTLIEHTPMLKYFNRTVTFGIRIIECSDNQSLDNQEPTIL